MHFPAFVCRDWIQSAPFFQQIDNVCPINCINSVLADKRSQSKEWLGRKWRQAEERRGRVTDAKLVWWEVSEMMSRETSFNRSWCSAAACLTRFEHKGDFWEGLPRRTPEHKHAPPQCSRCVHVEWIPKGNLSNRLCLREGLAAFIKWLIKAVR